jgi:hypothetical protein
MGANFLCGVMAIPKNQEPDWNAAQERLGKLAETDIERLAKEYSAEFGLDEEETEEETEFDEFSIRETLKKAFTEIRDAWNGNLTLYSRFEIKDLTLLITGDRTWGDPVEEINFMVLFEVSGMAEAAGFLV